MQVATVRLPLLPCAALVALNVLAFGRPALGQIKAFPQAEGFGAEAVGGRGGAVYHVTSLGDTNTPGTLRYGLQSLNPTVPVTIVFDVGGWINLNENLGITRSNVTIAGQTAPGGIGLKNRKFSIGGDNIIVRHMHFAYGVTPAATNDTINVNENSREVIFDHISAALSRDETFSVQSTELTLQWSSVSYGLQNHSAGSLLEQPHKLTFHHNIYAHNHTRNPKARVNETLDWINNVVYDYDIGFIAGDSGTTDYFWPANFDGNYYITGPNDSGNDMITSGHEQNFGLYFGTNAYDGDGDTNHDGEVLTRSSRTLGSHIGGTYTWSDTPFPVDDPVWQEETPQAAYERVLSEFGPTPWNRNDFDALIASNIANRQGSLISNQSQLPVGNGGFGTIIGGTAPADSDRDGMPDAWEQQHTPDLVTTVSNNADFDNDGYTDLEEYLNDTAAFKAAGPLEFDGSGRYADWSNWSRRWEPSKFDAVRIDQGTAVVDSVGQKAGIVRIGSHAGDNAALNIIDGCLEAREAVVIGADSAAMATVTLSGGILRTPLLEKGAQGAFDFSGGVLSADVVHFELVNEGGTIAPGNGIGQTQVLGDLTLMDGGLEIELASALLADSILVEGNVTLGGDLVVALLDGFAPASGSWKIIQATGNLTGSFASVPNGYTLQQQGNSLFLFVGDQPDLTGDYNQDGVVDAGDYTIWRDNFGAAIELPNEDATPGEVTAEDFEVWKSQFGESSDEGAKPTTQVPEPNATVILLSTPATALLLGLPRDRITGQRVDNSLGAAHRGPDPISH